MKKLATRVRDFFAAPIVDAVRSSTAEAVAQLSRQMGPDPATQIQLVLAYRRLLDERRALPQFSDVGFKCHSQTDEDGILLFLFAVLGVANKRCAEICAGDGIESNTANLILNHGWHGLLVDGDQTKVDRGRRFFEHSRHTYVYPPRFVCSWVKRDTINEILTSNGFSGEIDLLSLDLDGVDYWIWDAITVVSPRVVVLEYQDILGPERSWTVPYADDFSARNYPRTNGMPNFCGASLTAFVKLGRRKGYRLVGVNRYGYNAFFVRHDLGGDLLPEIDTRQCFGHPKAVWGMEERFPSIQNLPWVEV